MATLQTDTMQGRLTVRTGHRITINPFLDLSAARNIAHRFSGYSGVCEGYLDALGNSVSLDAKFELNENEGMRVWKDGKHTIVLDLPSARITNTSSTDYDIRPCLAICTSRSPMSSTKCLTRIGLATDQNTRNGISLETASEYLAEFRRSSNSISQWLGDNLKNMIKSEYPEYKTMDRSAFEVTCWGTSDERLQEPFYSLARGETTAESIMRSIDTKQALREHYGELFGGEVLLEDLLNSDTIHYWFSSFIDDVSTIHNTTERRESIYAMKTVDGVPSAIGITYDDSCELNLAQLSSLKVSRWIGRQL